MAALVVQSRFAGLKIEDDEYQETSDTQKTKKIKSNSVKKPEPAKKTTKNGNIKSQPATQKKKKSKPMAATSEQWETWKQKDEEMVDGNFECELQQAILLSKLDYEEKKDVYKQFKKDADVERKVLELSTKGNTKKQKKKTVMSLDQFNGMISGEEPKLYQDDEQLTDAQQKLPTKDTEFFERIKDETKNELLKDKIIDRVRNRTISDDIINRSQFAEALERKEKEIVTLKQEVIRLKEELLTVKSRNKKLCNILGQGEMKDKAEVLVEVERLRQVQTELTAEVGALHGQLERERSRHTEPRARDKKKKSANGDKEK